MGSDNYTGVVRGAITKEEYYAAAEPNRSIPEAVSAVGSVAAGEARPKPSQVALEPEDQLLGWQFYSNCFGVDPDLFFPERGASVKEAKEVCKGCLVREVCLEYALENGEKFGIWGGASERERRRMRRDLGISARRS